MDKTLASATARAASTSQVASTSQMPSTSHLPSAAVLARLATRQAPKITASALVSPLPPATRYILRGNSRVMLAAGSALGLEISQVACRAAVNGEVAALWLGPDEQLLLAPEGLELAATLTAALRELPHALVEVSHRQTAIEVRGAQAALLLNAGCPLDLDLSAFPIGMCTRTVVAKAEIVLWRTSEEVFHVEVWRSFAPYVTDFLAEASRELPLD
jgi:sarcosine oxidase subunit gamma